MTGSKVRNWVAPLGWGLFALLSFLNIRAVVLGATPLGQPWQSANGHLLDYRDIVVVPGRWLWSGGNPYDPVPYLAAHPWAQEFDPYAPSWLLVSSAFCWLDIPVGGAIYLTVGSCIMAATAVRLAKLIKPEWSWMLAPAVAVWMALWFPTRTSGSSFLLACAATFLVTSPRTDASAWKRALLLSIVLIKPQLGIPLSIMLLAGHEWRVVWRGWLLMALASLPAGIACIIAAGGPWEFAQSIGRVIQHASSPSAPTGILSPDSYRIDLPGLTARVTGEAPSTTLQLLLTAATLVPAALVLWRRPGHPLTPVLMMGAVILVPLHFNYDLAFWPVAAAAAVSHALQFRSKLSWATALVATAVFLHLHRVTGALGVTRLGGDILDVALLLVSMLLAAAVSMLGEPASPLDDTTDITEGESKELLV